MLLQLIIILDTLGLIVSGAAPLVQTELKLERTLAEKHIIYKITKGTTLVTASYVIISLASLLIKLWNENKTAKKQNLYRSFDIRHVTVSISYS